MTMAINFAMVRIYNEEFPFIKSLPQGLWPQNLTVWWLTIRNFDLLSHTTFWTQGHVRSCDKLKTFYLHYHNTYVTKPGRVVTYNKELFSIKPRPFYRLSRHRLLVSITAWLILKSEFNFLLQVQFYWLSCCQIIGLVFQKIAKKLQLP